MVHDKAVYYWKGEVCTNVKNVLTYKVLLKSDLQSASFFIFGGMTPFASLRASVLFFKMEEQW